MKFPNLFFTIIIFPLLLAPARASIAQVLESLIKVPTRPGVDQPFILVEPAAEPFASVILFAGGSGRLRTHRHGTEVRSKNFLVRSRQIIAGYGLLIAVVDTPSDRKQDGLFNFRTSVEHAQDIQGVIDRLRDKNNVPIFLVGTSRGTISAAGVAARLKSRRIAGVVLTSTVTRTNNRGDKEHVFDADLEQISTPVLVVYHENDGCYVTPFEDADRLMDSLVNARHKKLLSYKGGKDPESEACRALSEHGFFGIEERVVDDIVRWIKEQAKRPR
jgi:pimeloyl-ACP methyl ester carboxylesterase